MSIKHAYSFHLDGILDIYVSNDKVGYLNVLPAVTVNLILFFLDHLYIYSEYIVLCEHNHNSFEILIVADVRDLLELFPGTPQTPENVHIYLVSRNDFQVLRASIEVQQMHFQICGHHKEKILLEVSLERHSYPFQSKNMCIDRLSANQAFAKLVFREGKESYVIWSLNDVGLSILDWLALINRSQDVE